jgi:hypothetical protein
MADAIPPQGHSKCKLSDAANSGCVAKNKLRHKNAERYFSSGGNQERGPSITHHGYVFTSRSLSSECFSVVRFEVEGDMGGGGIGGPDDALSGHNRIKQLGGARLGFFSQIIP